MERHPTSGDTASTGDSHGAAATGSNDRDVLLKMSEALNADAMKWEEMRIKVSLAAIGLVAGIFAFVGNADKSVLRPSETLTIAAILIVTTGVLSFVVVGRYTQSFHREYSRGEAYRTAWLRNRDNAYAERRFKAAEWPSWRYYFNLWPLSQGVLALIGIGLLVISLCYPVMLKAASP